MYFVILPVVGVESVFCDTACSWYEECILCTACSCKEFVKNLKQA